MKKFYITSFILVLIDRVLKILVDNLNEDIVVIKDFFYITSVKNDGAAFSILSGNRLLFIVIGLLFIVFLIRYVSKYNVNKISYMMLFSGIIGNIIDRVFYGYVIDYLGFIIFKHNMPIFNFADILIVVGAFLFIVGDKNENNS